MEVNQKTHFLQLMKTIYAQKQAVIVWNHYIMQEILRIVFKPLDIDKCVFYQYYVIFLLC